MHRKRQATPDEVARFAKEYEDLLSSDVSENDVQQFLESHSELIPLPFLLNHALHLESVITKLPLGNTLITDFAYLTKSSVRWWLCLMELEDPKKKIFTTDRQRVVFSSDFNHALGQVESWKSFLEGDGRSTVLGALAPLLKVMSHNRVLFKYSLVYGRSGEFAGDQERINRFAQLDRGDLRVLTYDSVLSALHHNQPYRKNILSQKLNGFTLKQMNQPDTLLLSSLGPHELFLKPEQESLLRQDGFQIDRWKDGNLLKVNGRWTSFKDAEEARRGTVVIETS
jgi:hypothetical protein